MKRKVNTLAKQYSKLIESIETIDVIILGETAEIDTYDPYFIIEFDTFFNDTIPSPEERKKIFGNPGAFETSPVYPIDRFLINDLPILIYYRSVSSIHSLFDRIDHNQWIFRRETTNTLYRIKNGQIRYNRSTWFATIQQRLNTLRPTFWENIINSSGFLVENSLMELGVAILKNNHMLFQSALSGFMQNVIGLVFALNKEFTPPARLLSEQLQSLKILPDEFISRFESICRFDNDYAPERKVEIAKLIVKSILSLKLAGNA